MNDFVELAEIARRVKRHEQAAEAARLLLVVKLSRHMGDTSAEGIISAYEKIFSEEADKA